MDGRHFRTPDQLTSPRQGFGDQRVVLDSYTCDLNLNVDQSGYIGTPLTRGGFAYIWGGARATHGFKRGQVCFSVKILENLSVPHISQEEHNPHVVRVGFSCKCTSLHLGEDPLSWGYGGTGKSCLSGEFFKYGTRFCKGDIVTAFLDYQKTDVVVSFAVNRVYQGEAHRIPKNYLNGRGLFPHVFTRNCRFQVNFGQTQRILPQGLEYFRFPNDVPFQELERGYCPPRRTEDCQFMMMIGLPGSGKSTWVEEQCRRNPEKNFNVLGTDAIMNNMKVFGLKETYNARFQVLYKHAENCLDQLLDVASRRNRNYILDQTNVYASARERKIRVFDNFYRIAVVLVPSDEVYMKRLFYQRESGKFVPDKAILSMKANFSIPTQGEFFDEVIYEGMQLRKASALISAYNIQARNETGMQLPENHRSKGKPSVENITSRMAELNVTDSHSSPASKIGRKTNHSGQGRREHRWDGGSQTNMQEQGGSRSHSNSTSQQERYRRQNNRGRGPNRALSTSDINTGQYYSWNMQASNF